MRYAKIILMGCLALLVLAIALTASAVFAMTRFPSGSATSIFMVGFLTFLALCVIAAMVFDMYRDIQKFS